MSVLLWLVDFTPNLSDIFINHALDLSLCDATVEITEDEDELLGRILLEKLQVNFKDDLQETIV